MKSPRSIGFAVLVGLIVGAVVYGWISLFALHSRYGDPWMAVPEQVLIAMGAIAPGMAAGFLAHRSGFTAGGLAGVLTSIVASVLLANLYPDETEKNVLLYAIAHAIAGLITNGVAGIAGASLARSRDKDALSVKV